MRSCLRILKHIRVRTIHQSKQKICLKNLPWKLGSSNERETVVAVLVGVTRGAGQTGVREEMEDRMEEAVEEEDRLENTESELTVSEPGLAETEETSARGEMMMSA